MDRKSWIAIILSVAGLFAWQWYVTKYYPQPETTPAAPSPVVPAEPSTLAPTPAPWDRRHLPP